MHKRRSEDADRRRRRFGRRSVLALSTLGLSGCLRSSQNGPEEETTAETSPSEGTTTNTSDETEEPESEEGGSTDEKAESFDTDPGPPVLPIDPSLTWSAPSGGPTNRGVLDHAVEPAGDAALQWIHDRDPFSFAGTNPVSTGAHVAMSIDNNLEVLDTETGNRLWRAEEQNATVVRATDEVVEATITIRDGSALVTYGLSDGTERDRIEFDDQLQNPTVTEEGIYYTNYDNDAESGKLIARDRSSGEVRWHTSIESARPATPGVRDDTVYVGVQRTNADNSEPDGIVIAVDRATGTEKWRFSDLQRVRSPVSVTEETVFATSSDGPGLTAIDAATGEQRWTIETLNGTKVSPVVDDDAVYFGTSDEELYRINRADGTPDWRVDLEGRTENSSMALIGHTLYVPRSFAGADNDRSRLAAIDVNTGEIVWDVLFDNRNLSSVIPAGDTVFLGTTDFGYTEAPDRLLSFAAGPTEE